MEGLLLASITIWQITLLRRWMHMHFVLNCILLGNGLISASFILFFGVFYRWKMKCVSQGTFIFDNEVNLIYLHFWLFRCNEFLSIIFLIKWARYRLIILLVNFGVSLSPRGLPIHYLEYHAVLIWCAWKMKHLFFQVMPPYKSN